MKRLPRWLLWWVLPLVLAACAVLFPILSSGNRDSEFYLKWRGLLTIAGLVYVPLVLTHRFICWIVDMRDRAAKWREERPGFQVFAQRQQSDTISN